MSSRRTTKSFLIVFLGMMFILASGSQRSSAQQPARDVSKAQARSSRDWVRDGVVYEIFPRAFSPQGN